MFLSCSRMLSMFSWFWFWAKTLGMVAVKSRLTGLTSAFFSFPSFNSCVSISVCTLLLLLQLLKMMEKVVLPPFRPRRTEEEIRKECPWATIGRTKDRQPNIMTSLELTSSVMEARNIHFQEKYAEIREKEVRYETLDCDDADYIIVSFGSAARIAQKSIEIAREEGIKVGLFRPITLWPFPSKAIAEMAKGKKGVLVAEINAGQMVEDVKLAINGANSVEYFGRLGGIVPEPDEIVEALKKQFIK